MTFQVNSRSLLTKSTIHTFDVTASNSNGLPQVPFVLQFLSKEFSLTVKEITRVVEVKTLLLIENNFSGAQRQTQRKNKTTINAAIAAYHPPFSVKAAFNRNHNNPLIALPQELKLLVYEHCGASLLTLRKVCRIIHNDLPLPYVENHVWFRLRQHKSNPRSSLGPMGWLMAGEWIISDDSWSLPIRLRKWVKMDDVFALQRTHVKNLHLDINWWKDIYRTGISTGYTMRPDGIVVDSFDGLYVDFPIWRLILKAFPNLRKIRLDDHGLWEEGAGGDSKTTHLMCRLFMTCPLHLCLTLAIPTEERRGQMVEAQIDNVVHARYHRNTSILLRDGIEEHYAAMEEYHAKRAECRRRDHPELAHVGTDEQSCAMPHGEVLYLPLGLSKEESLTQCVELSQHH